MEDLSVELVKNRAIKGAVILTARNILIQAVSFFSIALLTFLLEPQDYGVFFIVSAVVSFLAYFGDIGFAASLIQKKEKLQDIELRTIFTAQQILVFSLISIVFLFTPVIRNFYHFDSGAIYLLWALAFSFVLSSLKTVPTVLLERKLEFNKYIIPQILEVLVFNITAVFFAWRGFGVASFTIAVILRGFVGLVSTYMVSPWIPGFAFSVASFKSLLKFGIPYQANTFLAMIKDDGMTLFLGGILGPTGVGLLGWAQKWAFAPLRFFMDQVIKVTFPAFSRMQDNKKELSNALSKSIFYICLLVFPALTFLILVAPSLVEVIPKYSKWSPALLALSFLSVTSALAAITTPLTNAFNAIG
ncbi:MAG: oligosaccharide flippase family protein, partial [Candidatus Daviesbacteria bacterium]|nr:oligosaccharide flippase family protein [Candidatus Daviesbacteria bacterium]